MKILRQEKWNAPVQIIFSILGFILFTAFFGNLVDHIAVYFFEVDWEELNPQTPTLFITLLLFIPCAVIYNIKRVVRAENGTLEEGLKIPFQRELKQKKTILTADADGLIIEQDAQLFFSLYAQRKDGFRILLDRKPNANPIKEVLYRLQKNELRSWPAATIIPTITP
jgi:hypothetical protein